MTSLVLFGGTGDLCKKKLIPALYQLHQKSMLPTDLKIIGAARRDRNTGTWLESLGEYPADFTNLCSYHRCDLSDVDSLRSLPIDGDTTFFLSVPPATSPDAIKKLVKFDSNS